TDFKVVYATPAGAPKKGRTAGRRGAVTFGHRNEPCGPRNPFGLGAGRGGGAALETLFEARAAGGPFHDLFDFASRVDAKKINKSVLEALVSCGALDSTLAAHGVSRSIAFASVDIALD